MRDRLRVQKKKPVDNLGACSILVEKIGFVGYIVFETQVQQFLRGLQHAAYTLILTLHTLPRVADSAHFLLTLKTRLGSFLYSLYCGPHKIDTQEPKKFSWPAADDVDRIAAHCISRRRRGLRQPSLECDTTGKICDRLARKTVLPNGHRLAQGLSDLRRRRHTRRFLERGHVRTAEGDVRKEPPRHAPVVVPLATCLGIDAA